MEKFITGRASLINTARWGILMAMMVLTTSPVLWAQQLDETWTVTAAGQTVQVNPDGSFRIPNISAADQFGPGGPGTAPDFMSDDVVRVFGISTANGVTRYAFSEPFQFRQGETFIVGDLTITEHPPPIPTDIRVSTPAAVIEAGQTTQLTVTGTLPDGSDLDVTNRDRWTTYRTSNPAIALVDADGLVTGQSIGSAFITATNNGATAVKRVIISDSIRTTTIAGFVRFENGTPVQGAVVRTAFSPPATTSMDGSFSFEVDLPPLS